MIKEYPDLISLIAHNREAMTYYKTLSDHTKCELSKNADQIRTIEGLKKHAASVIKRG